MSIDFSAPENATTYAGREAQADWHAAMRALCDVSGARVVDIGCGGGTYSLAWAALGAGRVIGLDASKPIAQSAARATEAHPRIDIRVATAAATGLRDACADIVFSRAVIHHLDDIGAAFREAFRILVPGGRFVVQDRTLDDVRAPASTEHLRGHFFRAVPRLLDIEAARRPKRSGVLAAMVEAGFDDATATTIWETRAIHPGPDTLAAELRARKGRSILHELSDRELERLVGMVIDVLPPGQSVVQRDSWTLWSAVKPR